VEGKEAHVGGGEIESRVAGKPSLMERSWGGAAGEPGEAGLEGAELKSGESRGE
jgi:hypothetical protein